MSERLKIVTLNIHKGLSHFNRRMVIHDLREGLRGIDPDIVFLQEVQGLNQRFAMRFAGCPPEPQHAFLAGDTWQHIYGCNAVYDHGPSIRAPRAAAQRSRGSRLAAQPALRLRSPVPARGRPQPSA